MRVSIGNFQYLFDVAMSEYLRGGYNTSALSFWVWSV
jgi:hypothetical protein